MTEILLGLLGLTLVFLLVVGALLWTSEQIDPSDDDGGDS